MYRIIPDEDLLAQVAALPVDALVSYAEALTMLEVAPTIAPAVHNADHRERPMREWCSDSEAHILLIHGPAERVPELGAERISG